MERIEYIPNTSEAIQDALARGGRLVGSPSIVGTDETRDLYYSVDIVSALADGFLVAVAFHVASNAIGATAKVIKGVERVIRNSRSLAKAVKEGKREKKPKDVTARAPKATADSAANGTRQKKVGAKKITRTKQRALA